MKFLSQAWRIALPAASLSQPSAISGNCHSTQADLAR